MTRRSPARAWITRLCAAALALGAAPAVGQGVHVAILPTGQTVAPGSTFTLSLEVTEPGSAFNGFDAVVEYDPAALTFVPLSPTSQQRGSYMLGACGSTFHRFNAAADSLSITDVLLCAGVSLPGPGQIYTLKFTASNTPQVTHVQFRSVRFYNGGLFVNPVFPADATIGIGVPVDVESQPFRPAGLALRAAPNPFRGRTSIQITNPLDGPQRVFIRDIQGRRVRNLEQGWFVPGTRLIQWDGRDDAGRPLPAGVYRITLQSEQATASTLAALLR
jgi:hypothetical protein